MYLTCLARENQIIMSLTTYILYYVRWENNVQQNMDTGNLYKPCNRKIENLQNYTKKFSEPL